MTNIFRGEWNPNTVYETAAIQGDGNNEIVEYEGALWEAFYYTQDQNPRSYTGVQGDPWVLMSGQTVNMNVVVPSWATNIQQDVNHVITAVPTIQVGYTSSNSVSLSWQSAVVLGVGDVSYYSVYVTNTATGVTSLAGSTQSTAFTVNGLAPSTSYTFTISATDSTGTSGNYVKTGHNASTNTDWNENPGSGANPTTGTVTTLPPSTSSRKYFSAYLDMGLVNADPQQISATAGVRDMTLSFQQSAGLDNATGVYLNSSGAPTLSWGGVSAVSTPLNQIIQEVKNLQAEGGTVTISIGGYTGNDPAVIAEQYAASLPGGYTAANIAKAAANLQAEYQSVISTYGVNNLDFDIEKESWAVRDGNGNLVSNPDGSQKYIAFADPVNDPSHGKDTVSDTDANNIRNTAIKNLQAANPNLKISFTLAATAQGLAADSLAVLTGAVAAGVNINVVNIMTMDYYDGDTKEAAPSGTGINDMYYNAVSAARAVEQQLVNLGIAGTTKIGITPMIGQNDETGSPSGVDEVFTTADALALDAFAAATPWVAGMGEWQLTRDTTSSTAHLGVTPSSDTSGVVQSAYQFTHDLAAIGNGRAKASDVNGDGVSEIVFRNTTTGDLGFDQIANGAVKGYTTLGPSSPSYSVVGIADFNGDGTSDILFRSNSSGDTGFYQMLNGVLQGWHDIGPSSAAYAVVGTGDFNGDGTADILYRNGSTGDTGYYQIVGGVLQGWHDIGASSTSYSVVGTGDYDGDGYSDVLYRAASGDTGFYSMGPTGTVSWQDIGASSAAYAIVGSGDFNNDGITDVLYRNSSTSDTGFYQMSSNGSHTWVDLGALAAGSTVAGTGDYTGDGFADILFRNDSTGAMNFYDVGGTTPGMHSLGASSPAYTVQKA